MPSPKPPKHPQSPPLPPPSENDLLIPLRLDALQRLRGRYVTVYTLPGKAFTGELKRCDETTLCVDDGEGGETVIMLENATGVTASTRRERR